MLSVKLDEGYLGLIWNNIFLGFLSMAFIQLAPTTAYGQIPKNLFFQLETADANFAKNNPVHSISKLSRVYNQLSVQSHKKYRVIPRQTHKIGIAKPGGTILIDYSVLAKPVDLVAFWLAHEWGHLDIGHAPNAQSPFQATFAAYLRRKQWPTSSEDEADEYATRFVARNGYAILPILQYMCALPASSRGRRHRSGRERSKRVAALYSFLTHKIIRSPCVMLTTSNQFKR